MFTVSKTRNFVKYLECFPYQYWSFWQSRRFQISHSHNWECQKVTQIDVVSLFTYNNQFSNFSSISCIEQCRSEDALDKDQFVSGDWMKNLFLHLPYTIERAFRKVLRLLVKVCEFMIIISFFICCSHLFIIFFAKPKRKKQHDIVSMWT